MRFYVVDGTGLTHSFFKINTSASIQFSLQSATKSCCAENCCTLLKKVYNYQKVILYWYLASYLKI